MRSWWMMVTMLALVGCDADPDAGTDDSSGDDSPSDTVDDTDAATGGEAQGRVRVVHLSPDAPAVSLWADGVGLLADDLAWGGATAWLEVPAGTYDLRIRAAGAMETDPVVFSVEGMAVEDGMDLTAIATGLLASTDPADAFRVLPLVEDFAAVDDGTIRARVVHASPDAGAVDLDIGNDDPGNPEVGGFARFADTGAAGVELPAQAALHVGIAAGGARVTSFTTPALPSGSTWTLIAAGRLGSLPREADGFAIFALGAEGQPVRVAQDPTIAVLHASPDAPAVDLFAGAGELADELAFGEITSIQVPPGTYDIDLHGHSAGSAAPNTAPAFTVGDLAVEAGERYLAVATGFLGSTDAADRFRVLAFVDAFETGLTDAQVGFVHASPDTPAVDVGPLSGSNLAATLFGDVAFGEAADAAAVPAGTYALGAAAAGTTAGLVRFDVTLGAGDRLWAIAAGQFPAGAPTHPLGLMVVDTAAWPWAVAGVPAAGL